jgi:hypothetical protein
MAGFEPARAFSAQRILSPLRLPFRHIGAGRRDFTHPPLQTNFFCGFMIGASRR